jgi:hypothetical protein
MRTEFDSVKTDLQDYIWPTDASMKVTSAFAEYRTTHFHGGIDIGTNGRTGYKVFAVRDGEIYRVRITPNGYGKMLFVRHDDGYYSTYAHLLTFNDTISALSREEQYRKGTFAIDYYPGRGRIRVKKGDVIAYTGDTGFGPAHLHFEIRDENLNPLNPMLCPGFEVRDNIPPRIRRILITPLDYASTIDNGAHSVILSRFPGRGGNFRIPQTLRMHGLIGLAVEAQDRVDGSGSKEGIHRLELYVDDSLTYAMQLDRVPSEETKQIDLHYDLPTIIHGWGKFQKLYIEKGNTLPFYHKQPAGTGVINTALLPEGEHDFRIVCSDISGNTTELSAKLLANHRPDLEVAKADEDEITLSGKDLGSVEQCILYGKKLAEHDWTQHTFPRARMEVDANGIEIPFSHGRYDVVKIIAESKWGSVSAPIIYFFNKPQGSSRDIHIGTDVNNDHVVVTVKSTGMFTEAPIMMLHEGDSVRSVLLDAVDLFTYTGRFTPLSSVMGSRTIEIGAEVNGQQTTASTPIDLYPVFATGKNAAAMLNGKVFLSYDSGAVYAPINVQGSVEYVHSTPVYVFEPDDILLNQGIKFSVDPGNDGPADHLGLYFRSIGGWIFQTSTRDPDRNTFSTTLQRTLGELAVLRDADPPSFGRLRTGSSRGKPYASFRYHDNLSGVDTDEIKMYIDDAPVIPEIDGERRLVSYAARDPLARGRHTMRITMSDRMRNISEIQRTITIR